MYSSRLSHRCATNRYFQVLGSIHDIESYLGIDNTLSLHACLFTSHWAHLSIIPLWLSSILFHLASSGTYSQWMYNPLASIQVSHGIWDPHSYTHALSTLVYLSHLPINSGMILSYGGVYHVLYTLGFCTLTQIYSIILILDLLSIMSLSISSLQYNMSTSSLKSIVMASTHLGRYNSYICLFKQFIVSYLSSPPLHISSHSMSLVSLALLLWSGHLIDIQCSSIGYPYPLSFLGGLKSNTSSITLSDISHHHLSVSILTLLG